MKLTPGLHYVLILHCPDRGDNEAAVEVLYHASTSELNDGDSDGQTPLSLAVSAGAYNTVKTLLALGADISHRYTVLNESLTGITLTLSQVYRTHRFFACFNFPIFCIFQR